MVAAAEKEPRHWPSTYMGNFFQGIRPTAQVVKVTAAFMWAPVVRRGGGGGGVVVLKVEKRATK